MNKEPRQLRIGVLGCGPISQAAHFEACRKARNAELYAMCDIAEDLVTRMAAVHEPRVTYLDYDQMLADPEVEAIIVAIADQFHVRAALKAIAAGKHVLVEKPAARCSHELASVRAAVQASGALVRVGFNHRYHRALRQAREIFESGVLGEMMFVRARYGHGGRVGYEREWRMLPARSGGGELTDRGHDALRHLAGCILADSKHGGILVHFAR